MHSWGKFQKSYITLNIDKTYTPMDMAYLNKNFIFFNIDNHKITLIKYANELFLY